MACEFQPLSADQIAQLTTQGCFCDDWSKVQVAGGFDPAKIKSTHFSGEIKLGLCDKQISFFGGVKKDAGITLATIHNCTIGDNVYINQVKNHIANYVIEDEAIIENINLLAVEGQSSFGNGTEVAVVNEAGGREIPIYDHLSAQTAYIIAFYRHRPKVIKKLKKMIADYTASVTSSMGLVAKGAKLINCRTVKNVRIGPAAHLEGIYRLENGSVNSCAEEPSYIGDGVIAEDFIAGSGSAITDGAIISKCFIGQGAIIGKQFSAENSVFFANCECLQGEACSVFAGPYTVTHHKSTLLIAGLFSFFNAGSGTNQSNHMYKLGPVHQGVIERGCKSASDCYLLWPARIGAFSVVVGRHYGRPDTPDFPFSYITEQNGQSILVPGTNLRKAGLVRDEIKWPKRDRRKKQKKPDFVNFKLLSPYTIGKILNGCATLAGHKQAAEAPSDCFSCPGVKIEGASIDNGLKLYQLAIDKFIGDSLIKQLQKKQLETKEELLTILSAETNAAAGKWVDLGGLLAPRQCVQKMLGDIESGTIDTLEKLIETFRLMYDSYCANEWAWVINLLQQRLGKAADKITIDDIIELITKWKTAVEKLGRLRLADGQKEYTGAVRAGYGLDGDEKTKQTDFEAVRGTFEKSSFACQIEQSIRTSSNIADKLIDEISKIKNKNAL